MSLVLHNTATRREEEFQPIDPSRVRLYVCGPTVYSFAHIGNARSAVVFDQLFRLLRQVYGAACVVYARNITDIDDKIIDAAHANGEAIGALTARTTEIYRSDMAALGCLDPTLEPRATDHIPDMVRMIETLIRDGHAYSAQGHVLFAVGSMPDYGRLSGRSLDEMRMGARIEVAPYKKDAGDFVLWKPSGDDQPGWDSPWGRGRPGWHIECSAMSDLHLGAHFDLHGGGLDLIFPHHENEIAQSDCAHGGERSVNVWLHNGFLDVDGQKMSKSLGNVLLVRDLLKRNQGETLRYALLSTHYREPLDWTEDRLRQAKSSLDRFYMALRLVEAIQPVMPETPAVLAALEDDLNTPLAQAQLHELVGILNKAAGADAQARAKGELLAAGHAMGLLDQSPEAWVRWQEEGASGLSDEEIDALVQARFDARRRRDFAEADRVRKLLIEHNVALEDGVQGTIWRRQQ